MSKYLRAKKDDPVSPSTILPICEVTSFAPASHLTDGTIPELSNIFSVYEVSEDFCTNNQQSCMEPIDPDDDTQGYKWQHSDEKWYQVKTMPECFCLYNTSTGIVTCNFAEYANNLETEIV